jgi:hypothetical protein
MLWIMATLGASLATLGIVALTVWRRCGANECGAELALGIVALPPAMMLLSVALLLLRLRERSSWLRRALVAACVTAAMTPLAAFLVRDAINLGVMAALLAALVFLVQRDPPAIDTPRKPRRGPAARLGRGDDAATVRSRAEYADPEQTLRLNAVRDAARSAESSSHRLQQSSMHLMTSIMRLRRAIAARGEVPADVVPDWMRRAREGPLPGEAPSPEALPRSANGDALGGEFVGDELELSVTLDTADVPAGVSLPQRRQ